MKRAAALLVTIVAASASVDIEEMMKGAKSVPLDVVHEGHVGGFSIGGVWREEDGELVHHPLKLSEKARRGANTLQSESFDAHTASGARTRTLLKLATLLTGSGTYTAWPETLLAEILAAGEGNFAPSNYASDVAAAQALTDTIVAELSALRSDFFTQFYPAVLGAITDPTLRAAAQIKLVASISAITWINPADGNMALVFRGTASSVNGIAAPIDFFDDTVMHALWAGNGMTKRAKEAWTNDAGLEWDASLVAEEAYGRRFESEKIPFEREALLAVGAFLRATEAQVGAQTAAAGQANPLDGITSEFAVKGGFPTVAKIIAMAFQYSRTNNLKLVLAGHSLGGSRAAAGSMLLAKMGIQVPALTFAAIGSACWTKRLLSGVSIQGAGTVDPGVPHNQITEYVHPLDPYGNILGRDVGKTCLFGKQADSKPTLSVASKWCKPFFGYPGNYLVRIETSALVSFLSGRASQAQQARLKQLLPLLSQTLTANDTRILAAFQRCRYFTHGGAALYQGLINEITEDGLTKDGCVDAPTFPINSDQCPYNFIATDSPPDDFEETTGGILFFIFISATALILLVIIAYCIFVKCCQKSEDSESTEEGEEGDSENPPDAGPDSEK